MTGPSPQSPTIEGMDVGIFGDGPHYVTYISGSGFQPDRSVKIQINRGGDQNEN